MLYVALLSVRNHRILVFQFSNLLTVFSYFHVRRLGYEAGGRFPGDLNTKYLNDLENGRSKISNDQLITTDATKHPMHSHAIPGVFNCRFSNPVGK